MGEIVRIIDYYDLIEFPSGRHLPVPLAIKHVGLEEVLKIPVAEKKRDGHFYYCERCAQEACWNCWEDCDGEFLCEWAIERGYSFFRCLRHKPPERYETKSKIELLKIFVENDMHEFLKYIEVHPKWRLISKGQIVIEKVELASAERAMVHYLYR